MIKIIRFPFPWKNHGWGLGPGLFYMHEGTIIISYWNYQTLYPIILFGYNVRIA